ncbi:unnamed protein product [Schistosoma curassoni]|uniref:Protein-tyrosine-phosphatase n=1 Tax=Schistosoma curassoni TaxID=6186 RepID=A0A183K6S2_9TREM|nr:unnamed protein product [Schistosoma curassoni]
MQRLPEDVRANGPLDSFSAFPFESYMRQIKDSVRSGFAVAKRAAQRYAERMSFSDRLQISGLTNTTPIGANDVSNKESAKDVLLLMQILESHRRNTSTDENTLPQNSEKPKRYSRISSTQLETLPSTSESKHVGGAIADQ